MSERERKKVWERERVREREKVSERERKTRELEGLRFLAKEPPLMICGKQTQHMYQ